MTNKVGLVLVKPQLPENIGFCARAMKNFGFKKLDLVSPKEKWPNKKAIATSVGANDLLKKTKIYSNIKTATYNYDIVYASSARVRDINKKHLSFKEFIKSIKKNRNKKIGIMFGPEASGLSNEDITYSNYIFKIPVSKNFESINLSHSLIIVCFEIFKALKPGYLTRNKKLKDITSKRKFNTFFDFLETRLDKKGFFVPREKKKAMLINLRNIFGRIELSNKELRILSSVFSKL
jgi:tRNA/rRNA methyltransferase